MFKRNSVQQLKPRYAGDPGATVKIVRKEQAIPGTITENGGWWHVKFDDGGIMVVHQDDIKCAF